MTKHRKSTHYRKISIAALAVGIVGVPTAAMACLNTQDSGSGKGTHQAQAERQAAPVAIRSTPSWTPGGQERTADGGHAGRSRTPVTKSPRPTSTPPVATTAPKPSAKPTKKPTRKPTAPAPTPTPTKPTATAPAPVTGPVAEVVALVNKERAKVGCPSLAVNAKLMTAAQNHSKDMAAHGNMSHTGSDGSDPGTRITRAGYLWSTYGENVAYGYATPQQVMTGWMNSPGHRQNILNCSFKEIGVGLAQPNSYWTQDFGASR
ncbi:CAP domain-containing protein [Streptomyces sp. NPDC089799]|uniref:CAP domain-containing protein n=1 Tax=Streptomyces sp. NPDC089799 TaxID=3155066 RepID=UPI003412F871